MTKSMVEGSPIKLILSFAVPLLIGNLLQQTYNMIDAAIVGKVLGSDALAAVGASSSVQFLVLGFCMGICAGFSVPIAKYFGAGDIRRLKSCVYHAYILAVFFSCILTGVTAYFCPQILHALKTPGNIYKDAYSYLFVIFLGIPFSILYNLLAGMLRAVGDSKTPFIFLAISTVLNIFFDLFCIVVLKLGCAGAAIATVFAQALSGIMCLFFMLRRMPLLRVDKQARELKKNVFSELLVMGLPMGLQYSITAIGSMVMQSANNGLGSIYVSGFTAASKLKQFAMCPFDAIATGVSVFAGQNLGAGNVKRIRKGIISGVLVGGGYGIFIGIVLILFGRPLSLLFVSAEDTKVLNASAKYCFCSGFFFWLLGILNTLRMTIQGLGFSGIAIFSGVLEMIARIAVSKIFVPLYGYTAICFTDQTAWVVATIYCIIICSFCLRRIERQLSSR